MKCDQQKTYLLDSESGLRDYYDFPSQLNISEGDSVVVGKLRLNSVLALESFVNLSVRERAIVDKHDSALGRDNLSFLTNNTYFAVFCAIPLAGLIMAVITMCKFRKSFSFYEKYLWQLITFSFVSIGFSLLSLLFFLHQEPYLILSNGVVILCGVVYALLCYRKKASAAAIFLSSGREDFYKNLRARSKLSAIALSPAPEEDAAEKPSKKKRGANPSKQNMVKHARKILEASHQELCIKELLIELKKIALGEIPSRVLNNEKRMNSYISGLVKDVREELRAEGMDVTQSPYRIIPLPPSESK